MIFPTGTYSIGKAFSLILIFSIVFGLVAWHYSNKIIPEYSSTVSLLFIQEQAGIYDPSASIRTAEQITETMAEVVTTEDFLNEVTGAGFVVADELYLEDKRRDYWQEVVSTQAQGSFLRINIFHEDPEIAKSMAAAAAYVLTTKTTKWHGGGSSVLVKMVDPPFTSLTPVRPNVPLNTILGIFVGLVISWAWLLYRSYFLSAQTTHVKEVGLTNERFHSDSGLDFNTQAKNGSISKQDEAELEEVNALLIGHAEKVYIEKINQANTALSKNQYLRSKEGKSVYKNGHLAMIKKAVKKLEKPFMKTELYI